LPASKNQRITATHATQQFAPHLISSSAGQKQAAGKWAKQTRRSKPIRARRAMVELAAIAAGIISVDESAA